MVIIPRRSEWWRSATLTAGPCVSLPLNRQLQTACLVGLGRSPLVLRSDRRVSYASPAVRQLFGWSDEEIIGTDITDLLHPDDRRALGRFLGTVVAAPGAHPPVELRVRRGQDWVWAEAALTNLLDDPNVRGVVCNLRHSLRRTAHEEAETRTQQLQTALETRVVIQQAKGYLAGRCGITPQAAFDLLRRVRPAASAGAAGHVPPRRRP